MRRETDFVLEKAAWPALVLEETGVIRRANSAALRLLGPSLTPPTSSLADFWGDKDAFSAQEFFARAKSQACPTVLRLANGQTRQFAAHCTPVLRDSQPFVILQFMESAGAASPQVTFPSSLVQAKPQPVDKPLPVSAPQAAQVKNHEDFSDEFIEKSIVFENSPWPVLLIQNHGMILSANRAAIDAFGTNISKTGAQFTSLWLSANRQPLLDFLMDPKNELHGPFRLKTGLPSLFSVVAYHPSPEFVVAQLFEPSFHSFSSSSASSKPSIAQSSGEHLPENSSGVPSGTAENPLFHKQKLDCALQLARSVSLDFNNALTSILGYTSLLLSKIEPNNPWRESLVEIEKSASKAAEIANDLANFSRQEKDNKVQMAGNLNMLLERAVDVFKADNPNVTWAMQLERRLCTANFDEAKMQQAFVKLLENSIQSFKSGGHISLQTLNLELTEATQDRTAKLNPGNYVCVEIADNGQGIPAEVLPRIFEPFFTTKGKDHRGLGLSWVYGIVTNHGGGVAVSSQVGTGTSVRLYIPANKKIVRSNVPVITDMTGHQTILIVDDEDLLLTMGQRILSTYGYNVITANNGSKALDIVVKKERPIHLMVTDLVMPGMSGRELTERVLKVSPQTRILWTSGYVRGSSAAENDAYLQKPFTSQDLLRKVKEILMYTQS